MVFLDSTLRLSSINSSSQYQHFEGAAWTDISHFLSCSRRPSPLNGLIFGSGIRQKSGLDFSFRCSVWGAVTIPCRGACVKTIVHLVNWKLFFSSSFDIKHLYWFFFFFSFSFHFIFVTFLLFFASLSPHIKMRQLHSFKRNVCLKDNCGFCEITFFFLVGSLCFKR